MVTHDKCSIHLITSLCKFEFKIKFSCILSVSCFGSSLRTAMNVLISFLRAWTICHWTRGKNRANQSIHFVVLSINLLSVLPMHSHWDARFCWVRIFGWYCSTLYLSWPSNYMYFDSIDTGGEWYSDETRF